MTDILGIIKTQREVRGWSEYQLAERSGLPAIHDFFMV